MFRKGEYRFSDNGMRKVEGARAHPNFLSKQEALRGASRMVLAWVPAGHPACEKIMLQQKLETRHAIPRTRRTGPASHDRSIAEQNRLKSPPWRGLFPRFAALY
jgi:hypothetical protein